MSTSNGGIVNDAARSAEDAQDAARVMSALDGAQVRSAEDVQAQAVLDNSRWII
jgi:hypothetical protein